MIGGSGGGAGTGSGGGSTSGSGTGTGNGGGGTGPTRTALTLSEPVPGKTIRALLGGRQIGYAVPLHDSLDRYLVRLPNSCAAPFEDRAAAMAALVSLAPRTT